MRHIEMDAAHFGAALVDDRDLLGGLDEVERLGKRIHDETRDARRIASLARAERHLSGMHLVVGLAHLLFGPRLQDRIGEVGNAIGRLDPGTARGAIIHIGKAFVEGDRSGSARRRLELVIEHEPGRGVGAHEVGHFRRQGLGVCVAAGLWGAALVAFGYSGTLWLALAMLAVAGAADFVSAVLRGTILLTATPDAMRGRLSGIEFAQVASAPSLGNLEAGVVASLTSLRFSVVSGGVACVAGTILCAVALPRFVRYDSRSPDA